MARILIADDSEFLRAHLRAFLQRPGWFLCGEAANGRQAVLMASQLKPDVIVLDFVMPMLNGIDAAREILKALPSVPIVLYTLHRNPQLERDAIEAGVRKVISKGEGSDLLIASLQELLAAGPTPLGPLCLPSKPSAELPAVPTPVIDLPTKTPRKLGSSEH